MLVLASGEAAAQARNPDLRPFQGAWVPEGSECKAVFYRQGKAIKFRNPGSTKRDGLLVEGGRLYGPRRRCSTINETAAATASEVTILCNNVGTNRKDKFSFTLQSISSDLIVRRSIVRNEDAVRLRRCSI